MSEHNFSKNETLANRLAGILTYLNSGQKLTIDKLAEEYGTHPKTIRRDFMRFESCKLPIHKEGQQYFLEQQYLGRLTFSDIQRFAKLSGIRHLYPDLDVSFIRELLDSRSQSIYNAKGYFFEDAAEFAQLFKVFGEAIQKNQQVGFLYKDEIRVVEPYRLVHHHGCWYLAAVRKGELRAYRLSRIAISHSHHHLLPFTPDPQISKQLENEESIWFGQDKQEIVLTIHSKVATHFKQRQLLPEQQIIKELDDGGLLISSKVVNALQILPLVRYWIPHVKIVNPEDLQEELEQGLREFLSF